MIMVLIGQSEKSRRNALNLREQMHSSPTSLEFRNAETLVGCIIFLALYATLSSHPGYKLCIFQITIVRQGSYTS